MIPVYIAHQYGGIDANRDKAAQFVRLAALYGYLPMCSWIVLTGVMSETPENRKLGLEIDCAQIDLCWQIWLCGPRLSDGMAIEKNHARIRRYSQPVIRERDFIGMNLLQAEQKLQREG